MNQNIIIIIYHSQAEYWSARLQLHHGHQRHRRGREGDAGDGRAHRAGGRAAPEQTGQGVPHHRPVHDPPHRHGHVHVLVSVQVRLGAVLPDGRDQRDPPPRGRHPRECQITTPRRVTLKDHDTWCQNLSHVLGC